MLNVLGLVAGPIVSLAGMVKAVGDFGGKDPAFAEALDHIRAMLALRWFVDEMKHRGFPGFEHLYAKRKEEFCQHDEVITKIAGMLKEES